MTIFPAFAEITTRDYAVLLTAEVQSDPSVINLKWPRDLNADSYIVYRKAPEEGSWGNQVGQYPGYATGHTDSTVTAGTLYEYRVEKYTSLGYRGRGYILAGRDIAPEEERGSVILLIDDAYTHPLAEKLTRLTEDLRGDGWKVIRHDISRSLTPPAVKALIRNDHTDDPRVRSVFIFGHVAVPYSGNIAPDGHTGDHKGAWPGDGYYGDLDGTWTDETVSNVTSAKSWNHNVPGDGKFDQSMFPSDIDLEVGRVDFHDITLYGISDTLLLERYLDKNHRFRHAVNVPAPRAFIGDNFSVFGGEAFASNGWRCFSTMFGPDSITGKSWGGTEFTSVTDYLWAYGCGYGHYDHVSGFGSSRGFVGKHIKSVFLMPFGSYAGDWDNPDNVLRMALAADGHPLTVMYAGRPYWQVHPMAMGKTTGFVTKLTQNNASTYHANYYARYVHIGLLGDPTLNMHPVAPVSGLTVTEEAGTSRITWRASPATVQGYHVYRSDTLRNSYTRINTALVTDTFFTDTAPPAGSNVYMVRTLHLQQSSSGTYYNLSTGISSPALYTFGVSPVPATAVLPPVVIGPNPTGGPVHLKLLPGTGKTMQVTMTDLTGRIFLTRTMGQAGTDRLSINLNRYPKGIYCFRFSVSGSPDRTFCRYIVYH